MDISNQFDRLQISSNLQNNSQIDRATWEYHSISVTRMPGFGFGIAVSGGRDNPHFANGDPSIAISDVLTGGPAEEKLQVNDRILSVNGVSLENVEYSTAVQVLRDSGNTVILSIKRRVVNTGYANSRNFDGAEPTVEPEFPNSELTESIKLVLTKSNKKDSFGIVLGCRLFIKELSPKVRDQLAESGYSLQEGDTILKIHNTYCNDTMEIKEAKKIISSCKDKLNLIVLRDSKNTCSRNNLNNSLQNTIQSSPQQILNCNNVIEENYMGAPNYTSQNLYVQPPSRAPCPILRDEKSNLTPRGRGPLVDPTLLQTDMPYTQTRSNQVLPIKIQSPKDVIRPQFQGGDDLYTSRPPPYNDDPLQWSNHTPEPRFISFQKEGSVGIRLTGGNEAGIFVTAVQPGSPASLQGLTPGDKILKVNDMEMNGITREEAVLFLLSLQDRIDLIVQHCKDQYEEIVAKQRGDSFYIKTHFHYENLTKGEMSFKGGDIFRVTDTLHNGVVGSWQVLKLGDAHDEMQRGIIPNKSRAEELATAQFNATKKEINSSESRGNFFRRRKSTHRRSKSLSKDYWDDVVFSDSITKFPAYERVVLRHPGFVRPIILFGPISDICRENLSKDFPDKFSSPLQGENKAGSNCRIVRLSNIRDIMDRGKHALLDITPNAVDRLNYAQFYPIVIFLKAESKYVIKQLRRGIPKSAHRSSKKLLEQCIKLEKCWSHIFNATIILNDSDSWYRKLREIIDVQQSGAVWMAVSKPVESLSDDFLFPMTTSRLSYASSPESDLETNAGPQGTVPAKSLSQLVKSCSDPSLSVNQENSKSERRTVDGTTSYMMSYNNQNGASSHFLEDQTITSTNNQGEIFSKTPGKHRNQPVNVPDFPPRVDRASKPVGYSGLELNQSRNAIETSTGREKVLFKQTVDNDKNYIRNDTNSHDTLMPKGFVSPATFVPYESMSSYDLLNANQSILQNMKLGPNAPDDLKSVPNTNRPLPPGLTGVHNMDYHYNPNDLTNSLDSHITKAANSYNTSVINNAESNPSLHHDVRILTADLSQQRATDLNVHNNSAKSVLETRTDYGKYSRTSTYQDDYNRSSNIPVPFKPVPPPKPKNYKPAIQGQSNSSGHWDGGAEMTMGTAGDMFVMPTSTHHHMQGYTNFDPYRQGSHHESNRVKNPSLGNYRQKTGVDRQALDLAGSREQRGSAFELYRKPQIGSSNLHNSGSKIISHKKVYNTCGQPELMIYESGHRRVEDICEKCTYSHGSKNRFHVLLKSPLAALKSAFSNKNKLLRRMGSMHEPNRKQSFLKRQLSMVECNSYLYKKRTSDNDFFHEIPFPNERQQNVFPFENQVSAAYQTSTPEPILKTSKLLRRHSIAERVEPPIYRFPSKFQSDQNAIYQTKKGSFLLQESKPINTKTKMQQTDIEPVYYFQKTYKSQSDWFERDMAVRRSRRNSDNSQQKLDIPDKIYLDNRTKAQKIRENTQKLGAEFRERLQQTRHEKMKSITELNDFSEQKNIIIDKASNEYNNITDDQNLNNYGLNKTTKDIVNSLPFQYENQDKAGIQYNSSLDDKLFEIPQNSTVEDCLVSSSSFSDKVENLQSPVTFTRNDGLSEVKISEEPNRNSRKPKSSVFVSATRDVFDELGGILCDAQWNVILDIPSGAIPAGVQQEIYFTVTDPRFSQPVGGPPLDMEKGETMLSPLVLCGPQGLKFLKPVTLNIPHFASRTPSLGLSIKATDSETQLKTNWDNIDLPENTSAHTVSVKIDHF